MPKTPVVDPFEEIAALLPSFEDDAEALLTLRQQAMADPPRGAPMQVTINGEEALIEPGQWLGEGFVDRRTGLPANCPVTALGSGGDSKNPTFFFLNTLGAVHELAPNAGKGHFDALYQGRPAFLAFAWPRWGKGNVVAGWDAEQCRQDHFAACAYKGTFELEDRVRGRGAWRDDDGSLIYHAGDAVYVGGRWRPPGEHGRFIYPARPKIGRPSGKYEKEGPGSPGDLLLQALHSWKWDRSELDPRLALGWLMTAMMGGAIEQRPVIYVVGTEGAGKSTLQKLLRLIMNGALVSTSNTTQAGIYQKVRQDSVAAMIDELEAKEDTRTTDKILELARIAYSGDKMQRGGKDGVGQEFAVMSSFMFSSIALPAMDAQDASRMAVLHMRERPRPEAGEKAVDVLRELGLREGKVAQALGAHLLQRCFKWFELKGNRSDWERLNEMFKDALIEAGHADRSADTFGALAAGAHIAVRDDFPREDELFEWMRLLRADQLDETSGRQKTWERCFWTLMDAQPEALRTTGHHRSIGSAVQAFIRQPANALDDLEKALKLCGLAVSFPKGADKIPEFARLFVPFNSPPLHDVYAGTPWAGRLGAPGPWGGVLKQMPREAWKVDVCDKALNRAAKGLKIDLAQVLDLDAMKEPSAEAA